MPHDEKLYEKCVQIYEADGQQAVIKHCRKINHPTWGRCQPCDYDESPIMDDMYKTCLVCGHSTYHNEENNQNTTERQHRKTTMKPTMKYTVNSIARIRTNKNRVFDLGFISTQIHKLDILAMNLPKSLQRSETGSGSCFLTNERDYTYSVRGYKRANALIAFFTEAMPRISIWITQSGKPLPSNFDQRAKKPTKKPTKKPSKESV